MEQKTSAIQKAFNNSIKKRMPNVIHIDNGKSFGDQSVIAIGTLQHNGYIIEKMSPYSPSNKGSIEKELRKLQQLNNAAI